jgi:diamine N-acetyltransferase
MRIVIRPLSIDDAKISINWRNDPEIWRFTGRRPDHIVTYEDELQWIKNVLSRDNERRFAIIANGHYVGNIQLTDINCEEAKYQIFIGEKEYWGKGVGYEATVLIISYAFDTLGLNSVYLKVKKDHERAINLYIKVGFLEVGRNEEFVTMSIRAPTR